MRISSFLLILLAALVALGYLLSDSNHLREELRTLQKEMEGLSLALQQTELAKQETLKALQTTGQELQLCQQDASRFEQLVSQFNKENTDLREQNRRMANEIQLLRAANASPQTQNQRGPVMAVSLIASMGIGVASIAWMGRKRLHRQSLFQRDVMKTGCYVHLTDAELRQLIHQRRTKTETRHNDWPT
ncbi:MAG TPA: hypothetical protein VJ821_02880 [Anaerolineales bacterium]|nr:hypothetical protein [Anaerolineales bacterium]